jgi:endonuclease/exonuclease/phosphatase family metal-dependent hydrolase
MTRLFSRPLVRTPGISHVARRVNRLIIRPRPRKGSEASEAAGGELRVNSWNLHKCVGTDGVFDPARSIAIIAELNADLVALQEADNRFGRRTGWLELARLAREVGLVPRRISELPDGHGWHGNALLVRPGTEARIRRLRLPGAGPRGAVVAEIELASGLLRVVAAHLGLLHGPNRQAAAVLQALAEGAPIPTLLLGDLDEWRPGARSSLRRLEPFFGPTPPAPPSFPARLPVLALDRILGWPQGIVTDVAAHDTPRARVASDHLPLTARVRLREGAQALPRAA